MLDSNKNDAIALALYQAFDAKVNAEIVQSVGYTWDAEILMSVRSLDHFTSLAPSYPFSRSFGSLFPVPYSLPLPHPPCRFVKL
jgi:hypothetical protein